ncbi:hypothetical protein [Collinsella sp. An2]|uniref:hypothetical protein n=1 Tax=Collinsella sp. An2 TaxID=1965585 RepID=UPI0031B7F138
MPVAPCAPEEVSRYGVIAGERVGAVEGACPQTDDVPGAVWRVAGMAGKPAVGEAPTSLFMVGRYLLSPLVMELLGSQEPGAGGGSSSPTRLRSLERGGMYVVVVDPRESLDTGTPAGWIAANAVMASHDGRLAAAFADAVEAMGDIAGLERS